MRTPEDPTRCFASEFRDDHASEPPKKRKEAPEIERAKKLLANARRRMSGLEIDLCERIVSGEAMEEGQFLTTQDRRDWQWLETNFAAELK